MQLVDHRIDDSDCQEDQGQTYQIPYPVGGAWSLMLWIEPFILNRSDLIVGIEVGISLVELVEQMLVFGHELVFAVRHVHGGEFQIVKMESIDKPLQRERVPYDLAFFLDADLLDRFLHVAAHDGVVAPAVVEHQMMAQAGVVDDHLQSLFAQVAEGLDLYLFVLRRDDALGEEGDGMTAVEAELIVEA